MTAAVTAKGSPRRYTRGDPCPCPTDERASKRHPCYGLLEKSWGGELRCTGSRGHSGCYHRWDVCGQCGKLLSERQRADAKYCSTRCRVAAFRRIRATRD